MMNVKMSLLNRHAIFLILLILIKLSNYHRRDRERRLVLELVLEKPVQWGPDSEGSPGGVGTIDGMKNIYYLRLLKSMIVSVVLRCSRLAEVASNIEEGWPFISLSVGTLVSYLISDTFGIPYVPSYMTDWFPCYFLEEVCPNRNISYWLYTRELNDIPYRLKPESESNLRHAPLSENSTLIVLIHGYTGNRDYSPNTELRPAYLEYGNYNIITIDWGEAAMEPCYLHAAYNVEQVAQCSARLIKSLYEYHPSSISPENTHIVGFSLGSHVSGSIGKYFQQLYNQTFPRITGLDPALPLFDSVLHHQDFFLDKTDADFVDVVHTNAGRKGRLYQVGHVDFYINNAGIQPGCLSNSSCDHVRAVEIFAESISSQDGFWGIPCTVRAAEFMIGFVSEACTLISSRTYNNSSLVLMGEHIDGSLNGTYLVRTNSHPPYAKGRMFY